jgi:hypothetical protein
MVALLTELMEPRADFGGEISPLRTWFKRGFEHLDFFGFEMPQTSEKLQCLCLEDSTAQLLPLIERCSTQSDVLKDFRQRYLSREVRGRESQKKPRRVVSVIELGSPSIHKNGRIDGLCSGRDRIHLGGYFTDATSPLQWHRSLPESLDPEQPSGDSHTWREWQNHGLRLD